jgi:diguanylate cyclase (GGDEF)-like protein/PAS domain S-box-containing protein
MKKRNTPVDYDLFVNAFYYAPIGKALVGLDGKWLKVNPALCKLLGYSEMELLAGSFQDITHPDDLDLDLQYVQKMIRGELETYRMEKRYIHKNGMVIWVLLSVSLVYDKNGTPLHFISQIIDITEQKSNERKMKENEEWLRLLAEHSTDFISKHTPSGLYTYVSPVCKKLLGYEAEEMRGCSVYSFVHAEDITALKNMHEHLAIHNGISNLQYRMKKQDGTYIWVQSASRPIYTEEGTMLEILVASHDISEKIETEMQLKKANELSSIDSLTQIPNRRICDETFAQAWKHALSSSKKLGIILIDIDCFKLYNDTYGHVKGDACLQKVASALQSTIKNQNDFIARYGGEEFLVILYDTNETRALIIAAQLRDTVESLKIPHETSTTCPYLTISLGVAVMIPTPAISPESFLDQADKALYEAKRCGRNQVSVYQ